MQKKLVKILIAVTILLIPAYLIRFTVFGIPTNVLEIFVLVTFLIFLFGEKFDWKKFYLANKIYILGITLIFSGLLISTFVSENYKIGLGIIKGWFAVPFVFAWILYEEIKTRQDLKDTIKWLYVSIFLVALVSLAYYFSGNLTYDGRLKAFYLSSNHLAMYLSPAIIIGLWLVQNQKSKIKNQKSNEKLKNYAALSVVIISLLIILSSLYLTYSYAAWLAIILSLVIIYLIINKEINKRAILIGLIIILLIIISQWNTEKFANLKSFTRSSMESRIMIWKSAGKILEDNLLWGIGPGNFQNKYLEYQKYFPLYLEWAAPQPHNLYLAFWLESGILGLAGFLILAVRRLKNLISLARKQKSGAFGTAAVLLGITLYILIHGLVDTPYWKNDLAMVFWIIFSLGFMVERLNVDPV